MEYSIGYFFFFYKKFLRILIFLCFIIKLLLNIVYVSVNNGIYKFVKLFFDFVCRFVMVIIYNYVFEYIL